MSAKPSRRRGRPPVIVAAIERVCASMVAAGYTFGGGRKCTRDEREARIVLVGELLHRQMLDAGTIERHLARAWQITGRSVRTYLRRARDRAAAEAAANPDTRITRETLRDALVERYHDCVAAGDNRTAIRALAALADLYGLRTQRHELTGPNAMPLTISPEEAGAQLQAAIDRVLARGGDTEGDPHP